MVGCSAGHNPLMPLDVDGVEVGVAQDVGQMVLAFVLVGDDGVAGFSLNEVGLAEFNAAIDGLHGIEVAVEVNADAVLFIEAQPRLAECLGGPEVGHAFRGTQEPLLAGVVCLERLAGRVDDSRYHLGGVAVDDGVLVADGELIECEVHGIVALDPFD